MVKLIAAIRPTTRDTLHAEGDSYEEAKADAASKVPDGWEPMDVRADKS